MRDESEQEPRSQPFLATHTESSRHVFEAILCCQEFYYANLFEAFLTN
jgi:hypothetical protein